MEKVPLGNSGIEVSRVCFGTWNVNTKQADWGPGDEDAAHRLLYHALDSGCNFVDTARGYGDSEEVLGRALKGRREDVVLATKLVQCPPEEVGPGVAASLQCLQTDYIDLYICHWPSPSKSLEAFFEALARERDAGRIRAIGVSNFNLAQLKVAVQFGAVSLQPPFSILWRFANDTLEFCRVNGIAVTPYSPLAQGLLTGRYSHGEGAATGPRKNNALFKEDLFPRSVEVAREVDRIAERMGCESSQVALAWVLQTPGITTPIVGASSAEQWDANIAALGVTLADEDYQRLDAMGRAVWGSEDPEDAMWGWKPQ